MFGFRWLLAKTIFNVSCELHALEVADVLLNACVDVKS